jgi:hypothetical protein
MEKVTPSGTLASFRPCVWPSQREPVEMAFVSKNKLLRAKVCLDEGLKLVTVLPISFQSGSCDLLMGSAEAAVTDQEESDVPSSWYIQPF